MDCVSCHYEHTHRKDWNAGIQDGKWVFAERLLVAAGTGETKIEAALGLVEIVYNVRN